MNTAAPTTTPSAQATAAATTPALTTAAPASAPAAVASPTTPAVETTHAQQPGSPGAAVAAVAAPTVAPTAGVAQVDPRAQINELAAMYGYEPAQLAQFTDPAAATAAIRFAVEQSANFGLGSLQAPGVQNPYQAAGQTSFTSPAVPPVASPVVAPAQPAAAVVAIDLKALGLEDDEPAAKAIRALEQQIAAGNATATQVVARLDAIETQARAAQQQRMQSEAASIVDGYRSPKYGTAAHRTPAQRVAVARLYDLADAIAIGQFNRQLPIPPLAARLAQAKLIDDTDAVAQAMAPQAPVANPAVLQTAGAPAGPAPAIATNPNARWSQDPAIRAALNLRT